MSSAGAMNTAFLFLFFFTTQSCLVCAFNCSSLYDRYPANSDMTVTCGPSNIILSINACPVQYAMFEPTLLALNGKHSLSYCMGTFNTSVDPPVVTFEFSINDTTQNSCGNMITIQESVGTGDFQQFSSVQTVVISGYVDTPVTSDTGLISYSTNLNYSFSCYYPLQYLMSNIELLTSSANVAVNTNNGSFISTLSMQLYTDENFNTTFQSNGTVLPLKKNVYVQVAATNLTANFNVLLDECFATPSPLTTTNDKFPLLTGCFPGNKTKILKNGESKSAAFSFETFRFLQHSGQTTSTIYVHCITRLCQPQTCQAYLQSCNGTVSPTTPAARRRRAADVAATGGATERVTVSSGPIITTDAGLSDPKCHLATCFEVNEALVGFVYFLPDSLTSLTTLQVQEVRKESTGQILPLSSSGSEVKQPEGSLTGLIVGLVIAIMLGALLSIACFILYKMLKLRASQTEKKGVDNFTFSGK